jgi:hypothetical protein
MSGVINFLRNPSGVVGKLFYLGGEDIDSALPAGSHYLECSNPDVQPISCDECEWGAGYSDGSFIHGELGDDVYNISEVETSILKYYNEIAPSGWDQAAYRPFRWQTTTNEKSPNKYKTVKMLLDKDGDVWYILAVLKKSTMESSHYINKLQKQFEED